ncbi:hypothetical protein SAMN05444000_105190 [Shimia gijangensis]|uniref:Glycosyltransferase 2-like domain-containing protein n=1 Tax=Shimia gijangensis TaxID=1470563 RepID=A0A1M6H141_9RHOB|nr:TIGR04283 family arsenosugar biosynthesis glycosyltransferase [Shimia gijangensis]SHJ15911.1 hypothetical protein SAMN05444000_105190 [Shimia gijangensis]
MRAPMSVVIPTLNAEAALAVCLPGLFEGVQAGMIRELIVVDGGSDDGTVVLAQDAGATVIETKPSRGAQLRRGCDVAKGEWLLVLHADSCLQDGWTNIVQAHLGQHRAGFFKLRFEGGGVMAAMVSGWANLRSRVFGLPFGDQGLLISRKLYEDVGGYPEFAVMEDVAMARALSGCLVALDCRITTSAERYHEQGWLRRGARNMLLQLRFLAGASPEKLARVYRKR